MWKEPSNEKGHKQGKESEIGKIYWVNKEIKINSFLKYTEICLEHWNNKKLYTSKCRKRTSAKVFRNRIGQRTDSTITTLLSLGFTTRYLNMKKYI